MDKNQGGFIGKLVVYAGLILILLLPISYSIYLLYVAINPFVAFQSSVATSDPEIEKIAMYISKQGKPELCEKARSYRLIPKLGSNPMGYIAACYSYLASYMNDIQIWNLSPENTNQNIKLSNKEFCRFIFNSNHPKGSFQIKELPTQNKQEIILPEMGSNGIKITLPYVINNKKVLTKIDNITFQRKFYLEGDTNEDNQVIFKQYSTYSNPPLPAQPGKPTFVNSSSLEKVTQWGKSTLGNDPKETVFVYSFVTGDSWFLFELDTLGPFNIDIFKVDIL